MNPGVWQSWHNIDPLGYGLVQWSPAGEKFLALQNFIDSNGNIDPNLADIMATSNPKQLMDLQLIYLILSMQPGGGEWYPSLTQPFYNKLPLQHT